MNQNNKKLIIFTVVAVVLYMVTKVQDRPVPVRSKRAKVVEELDTSEVIDIDSLNGELCMSNMEMFPGRMKWKPVSEWIPDGCRMKKYTLHEAKGCLEKKKYLIVGDSVGEQIYRQIIKEQNYMKLELVEWLGGHKAPHCPTMMCTRAFRDTASNTSDWILGRLWDPSTAQLYPMNAFNAHLVRQADVVVFSQGTWDMGAHYCGIRAFYDMLKVKINALKAQMKPGAKLYVWGLHWYHAVKPWGHPASSCNHPEKAKAFREAIRIASACTNVGLLETDEITKQAKQDTEDGVHYQNKTVMVKLDLLLNVACRDPPMEPRYMPASLCDGEADAKARWDANPIANYGCGLPHSTRADPTAGEKIEPGRMWETCPAFKLPKYDRSDPRVRGR
eukprot:TRINITY_DN10357_c0_g1_i1.p1 TRINITY_DN10357_c0_g1~~TRINITY_DN10357_c0_g1_i1.p1  ORF type:complete len:389 (+),score=41.32 TRINITY_DN10357_c0_g1_i1:38-1204(+)